MTRIPAGQVQPGDTIVFQCDGVRYVERVAHVKQNKRSVTLSFGPGMRARLKLDHPVTRQ